MRAIVMSLVVWTCLGWPAPAGATPGGAAAAQQLSRGVRNPAFPLPPVLEPRVRFWIRIYSEVTTDGGLVHDSEHLDVVYETLRFPSGTSQRVRERQVDARKAHYAGLLRSLARGGRANPSPEERHVLAAWGPNVSDATLQAAADRVRFQLGQADKFQAGIVRSGAWMDHIQDTFRERGLPLELSYLPHVESSFNPKAHSHAGASGIWQFTRSTGRRFMRIDSLVDERRDPYIATVAAARLLEENYRYTDTWPLALTSYNHGAGGMMRAKRQLGTSDIGTIVENYESRSFGFASRNFYCEFLAAVQVARNSETYFGPLQPDPAEDLEFVRLEAHFPLDALTRALGVDRGLLQIYNRGLLDPVWRGRNHVPKGYTLAVPRDPGRGDVQVALASIPASQRFVSQPAARTYTVRRGDTLSRIAKRQGVRESELASLNGLRSRNQLKVGQRLKLPGSGETLVLASAPQAGEAGAQQAAAERRSIEPGAQQAAGERASDLRYSVRAGDSLSEIAQRFGVPMKELAARNQISTRKPLGVGKVLVIPRGAGDAAAEPAPAQVARAADPAPPPPAPVAEPTAPEPAPEATPAPAPEAMPAPAPEPAVEVALASPPPEPPAPDPAPSAAPPATSAPDLPAFDASRYAVSGDGRIVVQPDETLGHYAEWLAVSEAGLRQLNRLGARKPVVIGSRFRLDLAKVSGAEFEKRRLEHHRTLRQRFVESFRLAGTDEYVLQRGDTLWQLSRKRPSVPLWLIRDLNPELDLSSLQPGDRLAIPRVEPHG